DQDARALADDEAVSVLVEGTARARRLVVPRGQRAHRAEPADSERRDGGLGAAGDRGVQVAVADQSERLADAVRARRARARRRVIDAARSEADRDLSGSQVSDQLRDEERRQLARAGL